MVGSPKFAIATDMDVSKALFESQVPSGGSESFVGAPVDTGDNRSIPCDIDNLEPPDGELPADEESSSASSDTDVIHIDLTERPPLLPMSGLALEQLISMLPGSTYAVPGSGVPLRSSPRNARQQSPAAGTPTPKSPAASAAFKSQAASDNDAVGISEADGFNEDAEADGSAAQSAEVCSSGRQPSAGRLRSPKMALTFVPGLGLVPVVINGSDDNEDDDDDDDDEDEDEEQNEGYQDIYDDCMDGLEFRDLNEVEASDSCSRDGGDTDGGRANDAALSHEASSSEDTAIDLGWLSPAQGGDCSSGAPAEPQASSGLRVPHYSAEANTHSDGKEMAADLANLNMNSGGSAIAENAATFSAGVAPNSDISEEQLQNIILLAEQGLELHEMVLGDGQGDDNDDPELPNGVDFDSPQRLDVQKRVLDAQSRCSLADTVARELQGASTGDVALCDASWDTTVAPEQKGAATAPGQESEEYEDDLVEDEVDDSGSGGGDEPDSILGGLSHTRFGLAADFLGTAATSAPQVEHTSTTVEMSALRELGSTCPSMPLGRSAGAALQGLGTQRSKIRVLDSRVFGAMQWPRLRYVTNSAALSYNALYDNQDEEFSSPSSSQSLEVASTANTSSVALDTLHTRLAETSANASEPSACENGSSRTASGGGCDLNSTLRMTGQSLAAIRQAALALEAQRQAKEMSERLGGGGYNAPRANRSVDRQHGVLPDVRVGRRSAATSANNPFGFAEHEASTAAGLMDAGGRRVALRRGGAGSSTGYAHMANRQQPVVDDDQAGDHEHDAMSVEEEHDDMGLEDLLRNRSIIEPRYPTDVKGHQNKRRDAGSGRKEAHDLNSAMEIDESGGWRPRHRRTLDVVDLDLLSTGETDDAEDTLKVGCGLRSRSADGSPPNERSLLATRKSDDGQNQMQYLTSPPASSSPRFDGGDSGSEDSVLSSSAHSVADERLVDELEALREELSQKTTLVAGLRGELRKYTDLTMRLEHQLHELRTQDGDAVSKARFRSQSDIGIKSSTASSGAPLPSSASGPPENPSQQRYHQYATPPQVPPQVPQLHETLTATRAAALPSPPSQNVGTASPEAGVAHTLPPHPQAQGLEGPARLALYRDILSHTEVQSARCGGPAPPDLRDAGELLVNKESLDAGTEKVMLIKLQKMLVWGCEAAWKASVAQQQTKFMEQASQELAQERVLWQAEREQLKQALEEALAVQVDAKSSGGRSLGIAGEAELRRKLRAAQDEAAAARNQAAELESAVALLNADVRKLRSRLRSSHDGVVDEAGTSSTGCADSQASLADSRAWAMERKLLQSTITSLKTELEQVRSAASLSTRAAGTGQHEPEVTSLVCGNMTQKIAETALEHVQQPRAERDTVLEDNASLRRQLDVAPLVDDASRAAVTTTAEAGGLDTLCSQVDLLQVELAAARDALECQTVDEKVVMALHEQQSTELQAQLASVKLQLERTAAELEDVTNRREEDRLALAKELSTSAERGTLINKLRELLLNCEMERDSLKAAYIQEKWHMEEKLLQARQALESAMYKAEKAVEHQAVVGGDQVSDSDESHALDVLEEALKEKTDECERLQQLMEAQTRELQNICEGERQARQVAEAKLADAQVAAASELARVVEEVAKQRARASTLEVELDVARTAAEVSRRMAESATAELSRVVGCVAGLQAECRDLRTALSAEDNLQVRLRGQVECLEFELEAQASLAQKSSEQAAQMEAALAEAEHHRQESAPEEAREGRRALAKLREAHAAAATAQQLSMALDARVQELQARLQTEEDKAVRSSSGGVHAMNQEQGYQGVPAEGSSRAVKLESGTVQQQAADGSGLMSQVLEEHISEQVVALRSERAQLRLNCEALQAELDRLQLGEAGRKGLEAQVETLKQQLQCMRSELQGVRAELQATLVELSVKAELMAAKDRSLATLQETVDALKLALQVTQQNFLPTLASPRQAASVESTAVEEDGEADGGDLHVFRGTVAALQSKFTASESTIRRLEQQVAALETRISTDESASPTPVIVHPPTSGILSSTPLSSAQLNATPDVTSAEKQPKDLDCSGGTAAAADLGQAVGDSPAHTLAHASSSEGSSLATINSLQMQVDQWRNMSEDLHARYLMKKDSLRRLREQLNSEQKRRVDEQAHAQAQLEAASQRLSLLATELGRALRRCITMDLHPLSSTSLTNSPPATCSGGAQADDINFLAALLARQGAALVECLEEALDQVNSVREERSVLTAQLSNRQAVLDEVRHHLAQHAPITTGRPEPAAVATATSPAATAFTTSTVSRRLSAIPPVPSPPLQSPRAFQTAALSLSQDLTGFSTQHMGLRQTSQAWNPRLTQQTTQRARSLSMATYPANAAGTYSLMSASVANPSVSPLRSRSNSAFAAPDGFSGLTGTVPDGSPPHAYVGILSGSREELRAPLGIASSTGGGLHSLGRHSFGRYGQLAGAPVFSDSSRVQEGSGRDARGFRSPSAVRLMGSPSSAAVALGASGMPTVPSIAGLSREHRIKLGENAL